MTDFQVSVANYVLDPENQKMLQILGSLILLAIGGVGAKALLIASRLGWKTAKLGGRGIAWCFSKAPPREAAEAILATLPLASEWKTNGFLHAPNLVISFDKDNGSGPMLVVRVKGENMTHLLNKREKKLIEETARPIIARLQTGLFDRETTKVLGILTGPSCEEIEMVSDGNEVNLAKKTPSAFGCPKAKGA